MLEPLLMYIELVLAAIAVLALAKSMYNGLVRDLTVASSRIPQMADRVEEIYEKQDNLTDVTVALALSQGDPRREVDPAEVVGDLRNDTGSERFLRETGDFYRGSPPHPNVQHDIDDEEEAYDLPYVDTAWSEEIEEPE